MPPLKRSNSPDVAAAETSHAKLAYRRRALRAGRSGPSSGSQPDHHQNRRAPVSVAPEASAPALEPLTQALFLSLRNVPLWACHVLGAVVVGLIAMVPHP